MARRDPHSNRRKLDQRRARSATARRAARTARSHEPELLREVRLRLNTGEPLDLLAEVSSLLASVDPRQQSPLQQAVAQRTAQDAQPRLPSLNELVRSFVDVDRLETTALLAGIAQLAGEELVRARAARELSARRHLLPVWLRTLERTEAYRCVEMSDALGDGNDVIVGARLPEAHELSAVVYIDHNLGTVAKDAFVLPIPISELIATMREQDEDSADTRFEELDRADARTRISEAIDWGASTFPPFESDTWPAARPLVEWIARLLPEGGHGYERPKWSGRAQRQLTEAFFASEFGGALDDADHRGLFESLLWYGTDYGPGDPLRWSPTAVEILLLDWIPRKIVAPSRYLAKAPELLRAFIRYAHARQGIRPARTKETLAAVDLHEPEYQQLIRSPRPQGPAALLAAIGALDPDGALELGLEPVDGGTRMLELLRAEVGGARELETLSDDPLADEPFAWDGIEADIRPKVAEVLELCDRCCDQLLDVEYRTACRRYLARIATGDPVVFRRRGASRTAAAAICWTLGVANELFHPHHGSMRVKDLLPHFGIAQGSVSQRAATLMKAAGIPSPHGYYAPSWDLNLGTAELLVSSRRRRIIELRDHYT